MATWADIYNPPLFVSPPDGSYNAAHLVTDTPGGLQDLPGLVRWQVDGAGTGIRALKFVKNDSTDVDAANLAAGDVVYWFDKNHTVVTPDQSSSITGNINDIAGIAIGVITKGNYGYIQVYGPSAAAITIQAAVTINAADALIGSTTDKLVNNVAANTAPTNKTLGFALAAGSGAGGTIAAGNAFINSL